VLRENFHEGALDFYSVSRPPSPHGLLTTLPSLLGETSEKDLKSELLSVSIFEQVERTSLLFLALLSPAPFPESS
jgi:hypothetical protein